MEKKKMDKAVVKYFLLAAVLVLVIRYFEEVLGMIGNIWQIATPLLMGCVIAYVLNIVMRRIERIYFPNSEKKAVIKTRRAVGIVGSIALILAIAVLIVTLVLPELINTIKLMGQGIPPFVESCIDWLVNNSSQFPELGKQLQSLEIDWASLTRNIFSYLTAGVGGLLNSTISIVTVVGGGVINFVVALIFAVYLLAGKEKLSAQIKRMLCAYLKEEKVQAVRKVLHTADNTFSSFIIGQCTEAVILGVLCILGMLLFQFPYAPMIGTFVGATALIPIVGAYLGAAVGAFMILTVSPLKALLFILFIIVLQQLEGNLIYPRVVGSSIGLPGMWVLAAVTIGGGLMGIPGMLLGVPLAATVYKLLAKDVRHRLKNGDSFRLSDKKNKKQKEELQKEKKKSKEQQKEKEKEKERNKEKNKEKNKEGAALAETEKPLTALQEALLLPDPVGGKKKKKSNVDSKTPEPGSAEHTVSRLLAEAEAKMRENPSEENIQDENRDVKKETAERVKEKSDREKPDRENSDRKNSDKEKPDKQKSDREKKEQKENFGGNREEKPAPREKQKPKKRQNPVKKQDEEKVQEPTKSEVSAKKPEAEKVQAPDKKPKSEKSGMPDKKQEPTKNEASVKKPEAEKSEAPAKKPEPEKTRTAEEKPARRSSVPPRPAERARQLPIKTADQISPVKKTDSSLEE